MFSVYSDQKCPPPIPPGWEGAVYLFLGGRGAGEDWFCLLIQGPEMKPHDKWAKLTGENEAREGGAPPPPPVSGRILGVGVLPWLLPPGWKLCVPLVGGRRGVGVGGGLELNYTGCVCV